MPEQKTCFVVMGFGKKTDFQAQRTLDLDKTYRAIIQRAVTEAGLKCIRADDVMHAGIIDKPMYELLLSADLVIADLSTSNANALYELGVRHALRPNTTIVIAENGFNFPFDLKSLLIRKYAHLGEGIDFDEVERMRVVLRDAIIALMADKATDSPVYTFLNGLNPPALQSAVGGFAAAATFGPPGAAPARTAAPAPPMAPAAVSVAMPAARADDHSAALLTEADAARDRGEFATAKVLLTTLLARRPNDTYLVQQLALCTYKAKAPTPAQALDDARKILLPLQPKSTLDPETLGLWGAIHKRMWDTGHQRADLDEAIWGYERGFYLRSDYYTGINYAFLLNERAQVSERASAIADFVIAERVRRKVIEACLAIHEQGGMKDDSGNMDVKATFWVLATLIEAYVGTGDEAMSRVFVDKAAAMKPPAWMFDSLQEQLGKLRALLTQQAALTNF